LLASGWELLKKNTVLGSCTACVVSLDRSSGRLRVANLGDSGLMIVRVMHFEHERSLVSRLALGLLAKELRKMDLVEDHLHGKFDDGGKRLVTGQVTGQATGQATPSGPSGSLAYDEMLLTNTLKASKKFATVTSLSWAQTDYLTTWASMKSPTALSSRT